MDNQGLEVIAEKVHRYFSAKHARREQAIPRCREVIRGCANTIRAVHRGEEDAARALLDDVRKSVAEIKEALQDHPDLYHSGFVHDAHKEYAEANITLAVVFGGALPDPDDLEIGYAAYMNGMGEVVGELRRQVLDAIRQGEVTRCERLLSVMDDFYSVLITMDFPDALTYGLRRTTDVARGILEKTRGDLTMAMSQRDLERRLRAFEDKLGQGPGRRQSDSSDGSDRSDGGPKG
ncbi:MAG: haloacid dehalogenase [Chloroflexi bacterium]|nr:haloacid dehalogenase [Chloroflexota bacterium]